MAVVWVGTPLHGSWRMVAVASVISGWDVGQTPWLLVDQIKITDARRSQVSLTALLIIAALAGVTVLPTLRLLFRLRGPNVSQHE